MRIIKYLCATEDVIISGIVRENTEGFHQLIQYEGLTILLKTLQKNEEKLIIKTTFLLSSLVRSQPDLRSKYTISKYSYYNKYLFCLIKIYSFFIWYDGEIRIN